MGANEENKAERILSIYSRLLEGRIIYKVEESVSYGVSPKTIQRDIANISELPSK